MVYSIFEILFLIFGWVFAVKGLVIASLVISAFWLIVGFVCLGLGAKKMKGCNFTFFIELVCIALSIICLCIRF